MGGGLVALIGELVTFLKYLLKGMILPLSTLVYSFVIIIYFFFYLCLLFNGF